MDDKAEKKKKKENEPVFQAERKHLKKISRKAPEKVSRGPEPDTKDAEIVTLEAAADPEDIKPVADAPDYVKGTVYKKYSLENTHFVQVTLEPYISHRNKD